MTGNKKIIILDKLNRLNKSLKPPKELGGVFLPKDFKERFDIMFVAEMPSMNNPREARASKENFNFNVTKRDRFFQEMLVKYGVGGSYVTDIVKERDFPRRPTEAEIKNWLPFLLKEIEIIQPKAIIVLGKRTYEQSFEPHIEPKLPKNIKTDYVFHYSSQVSKRKFERRFNEVIKKLSFWYNGVV